MSIGGDPPASYPAKYGALFANPKRPDMEAIGLQYVAAATEAVSAERW